jgi:hypothetical protein
MNKYIVSFYERNPLDPQDRLTVKRETILAVSKKEAGDIIANCDCEVIEVSTIDELFERITELKNQVANAQEGLRLMHSVAMKGEQSALTHIDNGVDTVDAVAWKDETDVSQYFNGIPAHASKTWRERHLNSGG